MGGRGNDIDLKARLREYQVKFEEERWEKDEAYKRIRILEEELKN